jgi:transcription elongation factor GreA
MTPRGYRLLQEELKRLTSVERPKIVKEIEEARAHGDISENAEYHAAKERQAQIEGRIRFVDDRLARAQVIDAGGQTADRVRFGATIEIEDLDSGERLTWRIVGEDEADVREGLISVTSPIARALLGKEIDANVKISVPRGTREIAILQIRYDG